MTDKERIEAIKRKRVFETGSKKEFIRANDIIWLINQTERALKNAEDLEDMDKQMASEQRRIRELEEENKRYKQALENIAISPIPLEIDDAVNIARQALEGTK